MLARLHRPTLHALGALALCATVAAPAAAQDQPTEFQSWRLPGGTFTPGVILGALYDTNVAIASPDVNKKTAADKLFQLAPFGRLDYFSPRTTFSSGYQSSLRRSFELGSLDGTDHHAHLSLPDPASTHVPYPPPPANPRLPPPPH